MNGATAVRLLSLAAVEIVALFVFARAFRLDRRDAKAMAALSLGAAAVLVALHPLVAVADYTDYEHYLHAIDRVSASMPARPLFVWIARRGGRFESIVWAEIVVAASLPALAFVAARAAGGSRREAAIAGVALAASAPLLVYAADANPVTPFAWWVVTAALGLEIAIRDERRAMATVALAFSALGSLAAFACREEGVFLAAVFPVAILATDRRPIRWRFAALAFWGVLFVAAHGAFSARNPEAYAFFVRRVDQYSHRIAHQVGPFVAGNGLGLGLLVAFWQRRRELRRTVFSPLVWPAVVFTLVYLNGAAAQEHQIVVLPLAIPFVVLGLAALCNDSPRAGRVAISVLALWVAGSTVALIAIALRAPKQREYLQLTRHPVSGADVYFAPYSGFTADPESPLQTLLDRSDRLFPLTPPPGCPPLLYAALAALHQRCVENHGPLTACLDAAAHAGRDWPDQAMAIARVVHSTAADLARQAEHGHSKWTHRWSPLDLRGTRPTAGGAHQQPIPYLFIPFWAHPDPLADTPAARLQSFRWLESVRLALDVPLENLYAAPNALTRVRVRSANEGAAQCSALRARPAAAALFRWLEGGPI